MSMFRDERSGLHHYTCKSSLKRIIYSYFTRIQINSHKPIKGVYYILCLITLVVYENLFLLECV